MALANVDIANKLETLADLLDIAGENPFKVRAYRNAAQTIEDSPIPVAEVILEGQTLPHLPGIGESISEKITELVVTGHIQALDELEHQLPPTLFELTQIAGLGPKRVSILHHQLGINTLADLRQAARKHKIQTLQGFGPKMEDKIRNELEKRALAPKRILLTVADQLAQPLLRYIQTLPGVEQAVVAGSYRRRKETVGDLDILITGKTRAKLMPRILKYEDIHEILWQGPTRASVILKAGLQVDFRVVPPQSYGAALLYFTGSKAHTIVLRTMAQQQGLKLNEYGLYRARKRMGINSEEALYRELGLAYVVPELRENRGEIEAAQEGRLPHLVNLRQLRGDLHTHTRASDGRHRLEEMVQAAQDKGYEYVAITDHTKQTTIAHGLDENRMVEHLRKIDSVNKRFDKIVVLKSAEVDILEDGSLDLPDWLLKELDVVLCSIHSNFHLPAQQQTERILRAMDNPFFHILGHPTGRLIDERDGYDVHLDKVIEAAAQRGCFLELNAQPKRLDLNDIYCKLAKDHRVKLVLSSDAHTVKGLHNISYGLDQARRGWLEAQDILNTLTWTELERTLRRRR